MQHLTLILAISAISLMVSFCCSVLEACLFSVSLSRIETLRRQGDPRAATMARIRSKIDEAIAAILIYNTIAHTLGAAWAGALVSEHFGSAAFGIFSAAFIFGVLFFSEIIPKSLGVRFSSFLAPKLAMPLQVMIWSIYPLVKICVTVPRLWKRKKEESHGSEEDLISFAQLIAGQGEINSSEAQWVSNALKLNDMTAFDLMTPNPVVARIPISMNLRDTTIDADHWRFSRLPVCANDNPDQILGVVHRRKIFNALAADQFDHTITELMEEAERVPETMPANRLLDRFLNKRKHLFCVYDEEDLFTGVITLEDVLEALLGREIVDETDQHEDMQELARQRKKKLLSRQ